VISAPLADGSLASVADEDEAALEQRIALADHLATAEAEVVARFSFPEGTHLRSPEVVIPREDLPKKLQIRTPMAVPAAVIPSSPLHISHPNEREVRVRAEAWIVILSLGYTGYVAIDERFPNEGRTEVTLKLEAERRFDAAIEKRIADEVKRLWLARGEGPSAYLGLLPARKSTLVPVDVELVRGEDGPEGRAAALKKRIAEKEKRERAVKVLESVGRAMHVTRKRFGRDPPPLVGREKEISLLTNLLSNAKENDRQSVLLVGRERVGKSALLLGWIDSELALAASASARTPIVYATSGAQLIAGMSGLGQWQERVRRVMQAAADLGAVIWFDDLSDLFSERGRSSVDVPSALRPWMEQGKVSLVGEMHEDEVDRAERKNVGFFASMSRLKVPPLDVPQTLEALQMRVAWDKKHTPDAPALAAEAIPPLVDLADRYLAYESFPGKAVRLYEELRAMHGANAKKKLGVDDMFEAASLRTGVPSFLLREDRTLQLREVFEQLRARVIGQDEAVQRVAETICVVKAGLQPRGKPLATFLFVGPTGVGKTELARSLADFLFSSNKEGGRITRFDMSEYMDALAADRLIRGDDRGDGVLTRKIRENPFSVLLLDEIEKAHPMVFDLLLQVCGEGRLTDAAGRTAYFHNAIIIMTSNLGAAERRTAVGFDRTSGTDQSHYERAARAAFRPEFLNRIDRIVSFRDLGPEHRKTLTAMAIDKVRRRRGLLEPGCALSVSDAALESLGEGGYTPELGARALRRHVEAKLVALVARMVSGYGNVTDVDFEVRTLAEEEPEGVVAKDDDGTYRITVHKRGSNKAVYEYAAMREISEVRRELARYLRFDRILELREHVRFLVAQLGYGKKEKEKLGRDAQEHGKLQAEHHRLGTLLATMDEGNDTVRAVEDLALDAYFRGQQVGPLRKEAFEARRTFVTPLASALIAQEPRRDEVSMILQELDDQKALNAYLPGLIEFAKASDWTIELHLDRGDRDDLPAWPKDRRWGPPRAYDDIESLLANKERAPMPLLLRAKGPEAIFLALEGGLHKWTGDGEANLFVTRLALRFRMGDDDWPKMDPDGPSVFPERIRSQPNRIHDRANSRTTIAQRRTIEVAPRVYWKRFLEVALAHLILFEEGKLDRDLGFRGRLPSEQDEIRTLLATEGKIAAIKRYRELTGVGLREAKIAVEDMEDE
jgi:ATP-dependent Clp protease ATP-binding subunit ClpC